MIWIGSSFQVFHNITLKCPFTMFLTSSESGCLDYYSFMFYSLLPEPSIVSWDTLEVNFWKHWMSQNIFVLLWHLISNLARYRILSSNSRNLRTLFLWLLLFLLKNIMSLFLLIFCKWPVLCPSTSTSHLSEIFKIYLSLKFHDDTLLEIWKKSCFVHCLLYSMGTFVSSSTGNFSECSLTISYLSFSLLYLSRMPIINTL